MTYFGNFIIASSSNSPGFLTYGIGAVLLVSGVMYLVFARENSMNEALTNTFFRSTGFALLISALLGFGIYEFTQPYFVARGIHYHSFTANDLCIGASIAIGLLLFLLWRARIVRARRRRRNRIKHGI